MNEKIKILGLEVLRLSAFPRLSMVGDKLWVTANDILTFGVPIRIQIEAVPRAISTSATSWITYATEISSVMCKAVYCCLCCGRVKDAE